MTEEDDTDTIEVEVKYRASDLAAPSQWNMMRGGWLTRRSIAGVGNIGIGAFLWFDPVDVGSAFEFGWASWMWWALQWFGFVLMVIGVLLLFRLFYTMYVIFRSPGKLWPGLEATDASVYFEFGPDGLQLAMEDREADYTWAEFTRVERWRDCFLMETEAQEWIIVPTRGFENDDEGRFVEMVRDHEVAGRLAE